MKISSHKDTTESVVLWEGRIDAIDYQTNEITAQLTDISNEEDAYTGVISFDEVLPDERDSVKLGAVFHLLERNDSPKLQLKFRRYPLWDKESIEEIFNSANKMLNEAQPK